MTSSPTVVDTSAVSRRSGRSRAGRDPILSIGKVFAWVAAVLCLIPLPLVVVVATTSNWTSGPWSGGITFDWLLDGWARISSNFAYSLRVALLVLAIDLAISLPASSLLARRRFRGRGLAMSITTMPIAIPGIALAIGLIISYPTMRPSGALLVGGHVLYTVPFMIATLVPALSNPRIREMELVAVTLGASALRRLLTITLPSIRTGLLASVILVFTLSLGEFNVSFFLFTPIQQPLPVELYNSFIVNRIEVAAAGTIWFLILVVPAAIILERFGGAKVSSA